MTFQAYYRDGTSDTISPELYVYYSRSDAVWPEDMIGINCDDSESPAARTLPTDLRPRAIVQEVRTGRMLTIVQRRVGQRATFRSYLAIDDHGMPVEITAAKLGQYQHSAHDHDPRSCRECAARYGLTYRSATQRHEGR